MRQPEQRVRAAPGVPAERPARALERPAPAGPGGAARPRELRGRGGPGPAQAPRLATAAGAGSLHLPHGAAAGVPADPVAEQNGPIPV